MSGADKRNHSQYQIYSTILDKREMERKAETGRERGRIKRTQ